jgi:hypothetical protein
MTHGKRKQEGNGILFGDRGISKCLWLIRSPDLTPPHVLVWDLLKEKVHTNRPRTINDLKDNVRLETVIVAADTLQRVVACLDHRIQLCLEVGVTIFSTLCDGTQFHKY